MGWNIVKHAFNMVFGNMGNALKASIGPVLVAIIVAIVVLLAFAMPIETLSRGSSDFSDIGVLTGIGLGLLVLLPVYLFVFAWVAVTWHRFILLEEYPSTIPAVSGRPILPYVGKSILLALVLVVVGVPIGFVVGLVVAPFAIIGDGAAILVAAIGGLAVGTVLTWVWFRVAVVLPATAVGSPMSIGEGWAITKPISRTIFNTALIVVALNIAASIAVSAVTAGIPLVGQGLDLVVSWVTLMVGVSVLTTIYGHVVEGRDLID